MSITEARAQAEAALSEYDAPRSSAHHADDPASALRALLAALPETPATDDRDSLVHLLFDQVTDDWDENDIGILADAVIAWMSTCRPSPPTDLRAHVEGVAYADDIAEGGESVPEDYERHYCEWDGEDWPCSTVRPILEAGYALASPPTEEQVEAAAWALLERGMDLADRSPSKQVFQDAKDDARAALLAAGAGSSVATEEQWEYALIAEGDTEPYSDISEDLDWLAETGDMGVSDHAVRRRPAGPWEPVEAAKTSRPCSCPSGDGSLRWPCAVHPPTGQDIPGFEGTSTALDALTIKKDT